MDEQQGRRHVLRQGIAPRRVLTGVAVGALVGLTALVGGAPADAAPRQAAVVTTSGVTPAARSTPLRLTPPAAAAAGAAAAVAPAAGAPSAPTRIGSCSVAMMDR